jgi:hypothetical protein
LGRGRGAAAEGAHRGEGIVTLPGDQHRALPESIAAARRKLDATPIEDLPYGIFVDGEIVACHFSRAEAAKPAFWWKRTYPGAKSEPTRRVTVRKRRPDDRVLGEGVVK